MTKVEETLDVFFYFYINHDLQWMEGGDHGLAGPRAQSHVVQGPDLVPEAVINLLLLMVGEIVQAQVHQQKIVTHVAVKV